ncbi:MAG: hypothetical protein COT73_07815 [Bdellovibrio sp. CG10_big_fil_rev_8_21_14_0_10_47_8]|nr:MAG: hypothetical protein COT73_07815 [Bdellovibrio sp. CG10_big_fil_rev_8_21_14_0_10_47_8]
MRQKIQIIIDNPLRDLPSGVLLAAHLVKKGLNVILTPFDNAPFETFRFCPHYLLVNYARKTNETYMSRVLSARIPLGVLDTEGGVFVKLENEGGKPNFVKTLTENKSVISQLKDYFVWGNFIFDFMKKEWPSAVSALQLMGTPRTDALHSKWAEPHQQREFILINTSFTLINTKFRSSEEEINDLVHRFGYERARLEQEYQVQKKVASEFLATVKKVAEEFPNESFVLRPHPFERHDMYLQEFKDSKNVVVRGDQAIDHWLSQSKALIHYECSTAIEAGLVGVPAFSLKSAAHTRPIEAISLLTDYCESEQDLNEKISQVLNKTYQPPSTFQKNLQQVIETIYYRFDGESSSRIADHLANKISHLEKPSILRSWLWFSFYFFRNLAKKLLGKQLVRDSKKFTLAQVQTSLRRFQAAQETIPKDIRLVQNGDSIILSQ